MKLRNKYVLAFMVLVLSMLIIYFLWFSIRPVEVIAIHQRNSFSDVLVKNYPFTDRGKIHWWLKNKDMLKTKYDIPKSSFSGSYAIAFWYFGDGYKEEGKYDRLCFEDMAPPLNCIEKDRAFTVRGDNHGNISFGVNDGEYYINKSGGMIKKKY